MKQIALGTAEDLAVPGLVVMPADVSGLRVPAELSAAERPRAAARQLLRLGAEPCHAPQERC